MRKLWQRQAITAGDQEARALDVGTPERAAEHPRATVLNEPVDVPSSHLRTLGAKPIPTGKVRASSAATVIGESVRIVGEFEAAEDIQIAGCLEGSIKLKENRLSILSGARVRADIEARELSVGGVVEGNIRCSQSLVLESSARVVGDIGMRRLNVIDGAVLNGKITMLAPMD